MIMLLFMAVITVSIELPSGEVQCATAVPVSYHLAERLVIVSDCSYTLFADGFEDE